MTKRIKSFANKCSSLFFPTTFFSKANAMNTRNRTRNVLTLASVATLTFAAASANAALVGHWKFDEGSGTTAADSSGNGYDADQTIVAGSWITGKAGGAYDIPRFSMDAAESDVLNFAGTGTVTLSAWVTDRTGSNFEGIAGFEGTSTAGDIYSLKMDSADKINWTVLPSHSPLASSDTLANYAAATGDGWVHVVGVFEQSVGSTLYVNGSVAATTGAAGSPIADKTPPGTFNIGRYYNTSSFAFTGAIDDVQVYDEALSVDDIAFLFNNPGSALGGAAAVPEPSTMILAALGLVGLMGTRRRRRR